MKKRRENAVAKALKEKPTVARDASTPDGFYRVKDTYWVQVYKDADGQCFIHCGCAAGEPPIDEATGLPSRESAICYHAASVLIHIAEEEKESDVSE